MKFKYYDNKNNHKEQSELRNLLIENIKKGIAVKRSRDALSLLLIQDIKKDIEEQFDNT